jgi:SAM-dependent methyltransferase
VRVDLGDARTLDGMPDAHFGLVTFAWNGIDAVSHADRARVLAAVRRVLAPGGMFFFSTLNLDGPDVRERPWHVPLEPTRNPLVMSIRAARAARYVAKFMVNWVRLLPMIERGPGYAVAPLGAHDFSILAHYTTLERQFDELDEAGFSRDALAFASVTGERIYPGDDTRDVSYFHLVATART